MRRKTTSILHGNFMLLTLLLAVAALTHSCKKDDPVPAPTITDFSPASGLAGASVTITGANFDPTAGNNKVDFNGVSGNVTSASGTSLTVTVPAGATTGKINVLVNNQQVSSSTDFTVITPSIKSFSPASGAAGASVTLSGDFDPDVTNNSVTINGITATIISGSATQLVVTVPNTATSGVIKVTVGGNTLTSANSFAVLPTITSLSASSGLPGDLMTIYGNNFDPTPANNIVKVNGLPATVTSALSSQLRITLPVTSTYGNVTVTVGGNTATSTNMVSISSVFSSFSPTSGVAGTAVTITGDGFDPILAHNVVKLNGIIANVTSAAQKQLVVLVPQTATSGTISVEINGTGPHTPPVTGPQAFNILSPTISSFSPSIGAPGVTVVISGSHFSPVPEDNIVTFNGTAATVSGSTSTTLTVVVPTGVSAGKIAVTVGPNSVTSTDNFAICNGIQLYLSDIVVTSVSQDKTSLNYTYKVTNVGATPYTSPVYNGNTLTTSAGLQNIAMANSNDPDNFGVFAYGNTIGAQATPVTWQTGTTYSSNYYSGLTGTGHTFALGDRPFLRVELNTYNLTQCDVTKGQVQTILVN